MDVFPKMGGTPSHHPFLDGIFSKKNNHFLGIPILGNHHMYIHVYCAHLYHLPTWNVVGWMMMMMMMMTENSKGQTNSNVISAQCLSLVQWLNDIPYVELEAINKLRYATNSFKTSKIILYMIHLQWYTPWLSTTHQSSLYSHQHGTGCRYVEVALMFLLIWIRSEVQKAARRPDDMSHLES